MRIIFIFLFFINLAQSKDLYDKIEEVFSPTLYQMMKGKTSYEAYGGQISFPGGGNGKTLIVSYSSENQKINGFRLFIPNGSFKVIMNHLNGICTDDIKCELYNISTKEKLLNPTSEDEIKRICEPSYSYRSCSLNIISSPLNWDHVDNLNLFHSTKK